MAKAGTHLHGCPECFNTFLCACKDYYSNPKCIPCLGKTGPSLMAQGRFPGSCCPSQVRTPRKQELIDYKLAGSQSWFICAECKRAFNYRPQERIK